MNAIKIRPEAGGRHGSSVPVWLESAGSAVTNVPPAPLGPPFELPEWLIPWWEALKSVVPGSEFAGALPGGKAALGGVITQVNRMIREECSKGNTEKCEFYQDLRDKLVRIYQNMKEDE